LTKDFGLVIINLLVNREILDGGLNLFLFAIIIFVIGMDQFSKWLITRSLVMHQSVNVLPGVISFTRISNPGAAFGILQNKMVLLIVTPLLLFSLVFLFRKEIMQYSFPFRFGLALCVGGGVGNLIDRLGNQGHVIDFIDLEFWPFKNFPVFNLADTAIFVGAILVFGALARLEN
jgi:signal peptidase II